MSIIRYYIYLLLVLLFCLSIEYATARAGECENSAVTFNYKKVISILRSGGFSGVLDDHVDLMPIGAIKVSDTCLELVVYKYTDSTSGPMVVHHMSKRLLILSKSVYLGTYAIDELPINITGNVLNFPGEKAEGNSIVFDSKLPPKKIYLDGELRKLFK